MKDALVACDGFALDDEVIAPNTPRRCACGLCEGTVKGTVCVQRVRAVRAVSRSSIVI